MNESTDNIREIPFSNFDLPDVLRRGVAETGFTACTPIQAATLPLMLAGKDVAGQAQTGTGKTAAFLLATMNHLIRAPAHPKRRLNQPRAVILAPTRELAIQIHKDAVSLGKYADLRVGVVYGGAGYESQRALFEIGVDILIGTPGRIIDYFKQNVFDLKAVQAVVLDEADRMFDLGFIKDIRYLLRQMPSPDKRLGLLFSATLSFRVTELAYEHMNNPQLVKIESDRVTADNVSQIVYHTASNEKAAALIGLLKHMDPTHKDVLVSREAGCRERPTRTIVFVNTKRAADQVWGALEANGFETAVLSGDVPQAKRMALLARFQAGELPVLVATDVAARGLHIPAVSHVFNFDLPQDAEDYVHRIGRTARAGASGDAISFACEEYAFSLPDIEKYIGHKIPVGRIDDDWLNAVLVPAVRHDSRPANLKGDARRGAGGSGATKRRSSGARPTHGKGVRRNAS
jgi:ATP-dependent RNA helicase RhlB